MISLLPVVALGVCAVGSGIHLRDDAWQPRLAIVSAQFGGKDKVSSLPDLPADLQGFFFTGSAPSDVLIGASWKLVTRAYHLEYNATWGKLDTRGKYSLSVCSDGHVRGCMSAKFYKMNAHLLPELQDVDMILWTDSITLNPDHKYSRGSLPLVGSMARRAANVLGSDDFVVQHHESRHSVSSEISFAAARASKTQGVGMGEVREEMQQALKAMRSEGFKDRLGLFRGEQFLYRSTSAAARGMLEYWWALSQNYTFRDQISLPWALERSLVKMKAPCHAKHYPRYRSKSCIAPLITETSP